jgi:HD-GYP domain-containing protein (c-di-GMP phosphodiesterase class II)
LHDIGKIAVDEYILNKEGPLTEKEWWQIKKHPETGYRILNTSSEYTNITEAAFFHHERWDGTGYPRGLVREDIPLCARIVAVADAYDAMTAYRTYRKPLTNEQALQEINHCSGSQFDPMIVEAMLRLMANETGSTRDLLYGIA